MTILLLVIPLYTMLGIILDTGLEELLEKLSNARSDLRAK